MKKYLLFSITALCGFALSHAAISVTNSGLTFSPANITIKTTDTVVFTLASIHDVREVSLATYNANGTTALPGGFSVAFGGGTLTGVTAGTHYYVCTNHASMGMKGQIIAQTSAAVRPFTAQSPNTFTFLILGSASIAFNIPGQTFRISILDMKGRSVWSTTALKTGARNLSWDGKLTNGGHLAAGTYFVQVMGLDAAQKSVGQVSRTLVLLN